MVNRHVTPRGQVWKWDFGKMGFWENGFLGEIDAARGIKIFYRIKPILKNLMPIGYKLGKSQRFTQIFKRKHSICLMNKVA
jgi:hypothetical protein